MRALLVFLAACAVAPAQLPANHPANASAPTGRLAGAPATLAPGSVKYDDVPAHVEPTEHHHHHHGS